MESFSNYAAVSLSTSPYSLPIIPKAHHNECLDADSALTGLFFSPPSLPLEINKHQLLSRHGNHHTANSKFRRTPDWSTSLSIRIITTTFIRAATSHIIFYEHTVDSEQFWQQWLFLPEGHHKHQDCNALRCPMSITAQRRELFYHAWNVLHTNGWSYFTFHWN